MSISKSNARRLAMNSIEMGAHVLRGLLTVGPDGMMIDGTDIDEWLALHANQELILIVAQVGPVEVSDQVKTCYTCGRDYKGDTCPRCAEARARLRG